MTKLTMSTQPPALKFLFFSEMWERFSFYGIKALLVLYMIKHLSFHDSAAYSVLGAYATFVYSSLIIGGYLTDKFLGSNKGIIFGAILISLGHFSLAFGEGFIFYLGLGLIICGTGFFKGNITSFLGQFYKEHDPRRDSGFTIFYMGINIGGLVAPILCGYLANRYGWHYGFAAAGVGMLLGLLTFLQGNKTFEGKGEPQNDNQVINTLIYSGTILSAPLFALMIQHHEHMNKALPVIGIFTLLYMIKIAINSNAIERANIFTLGLMMIFVLIFLAFWEQIASSLNVFADRYVDRDISFLNIKGFKEIPTAWLQSLNALFILLLAPLLSYVWKSFDDIQCKIYTPFKFVIGFILLGLGFLTFKYAANQAVINGKASLLYIILGYMFYTAGELAMLPIGFSMVSRLAPSNKSSIFMGIWFVGFAFAQHVAATLAKLTAPPQISTEDLSSINGTVLFERLFSHITSFTFATALILAVISIFTLKVFKRVE
jgi:POT family proton-dependent oligopeptide transporter